MEKDTRPGGCEWADQPHASRGSLGTLTVAGDGDKILSGELHCGNDDDRAAC